MDELTRFQELVAPVSSDELRRLRSRVRTHVDLVDEHSLSNEFVQIDLAQKVASALFKLIDSAPTLSLDHVALVRGAAEYFLLTHDEDDDVRSPIGIEDDARVVNHVCDQLGRTDLKIAL